MNSFRTFNRRAGSIFAAAAIVFATAIPGVVSALTITVRSIELSSSVKATTGVSYTVDFTAETNGTGAFMLDFCTTPAIGAACTTPTGLTVTTPSTTGSDTVSATDTNSVKVVLAASVDADDPVSVELGGLTNPTDAGAIYARIVTYTDDTALTANYVDEDTLGTHKDDGAVALTITDGFSVSGAVLESLAFCASGADTIATGCTSGVTAPSLVLGTNGVLDLAPSEGTIYSQLSTNAVGGAVVSLKSATAGGGLKRPEAASSDITPLTTPTPTTFPTGTAKFGLKLAGLTNTIKSGSYDENSYYLGTAVTSTYGDPIFNVTGPVSDGVADLVFAATSSNTTPAGSYSASLNLIATGKF